MERRVFGLTEVQLCRLAFDYAEQNNLPHWFNKLSNLAGKNWTFQMKFKICLRTSESTLIGRFMDFNKIAVEKFQSIKF